ncbi:thermonuclease family protein [SAR202 cluster bacterium AD-812-D07_MRT_10900m]|nr:thermonuclease family protein [SAR202 cluster bacterium AD-812-D07_MRT_10900m]
MVTVVIDGDTVELASGERVRYIGIDTPETLHPDKPVECLGAEATARNRQLVEGKIVHLLADGEDRDQYGRLLRYVYVDNTFVNGQLVWEGLAFARSFGEQPRLYQTLVQLERSARENFRGVWIDCGNVPAIT